jgi:gas vesicle protein
MEMALQNPSLRLYTIFSTKMNISQDTAEEAVNAVQELINGTIQYKTNSLSTKEDILQLRNEIKEEIAQFRHETKEDIHSLKEEMSQLRSENKEDIHLLKEDILQFKNEIKEEIHLLKEEMAQQRSENKEDNHLLKEQMLQFENRMGDKTADQYKWFIGGFITIIVLIVSLFVTMIFRK